MDYGYLFALLWTILVVYWIAHSRGNKKNLIPGKPWFRAVFFIAFIAGFSLLRMDPGWPTTQLIPRSDALSILGLVLCALGIGFAIWARRTLGTNWSAIPTIKEGHELVMRGPYRLARHPIYTGILLALLGNNLAYGAVYNAILFVFCAAGIIWKLKIEERLMMQQFPEVYPEYKKQVKALVPFVF